MATQKPGEWANTLIVRFEEQVSELPGYVAGFNKFKWKKNLPPI